MTTYFKIIQSVKSVNKQWHEEIAKNQIERLIRMEYEHLKNEYPDEYFELIKVTHNEECLNFSTETNRNKPKGLKR